MNNFDVKTEGIKLLLYAGTIIVAIALAYGSLSSQQAENARNTMDLQNTTDKIKNDQTGMKVDIAVIKTTLQIAQERGQIGNVPRRSFIALAAPTIEGTLAISPSQPAPQQITYNATFITSTSPTQPQPTSIPQPTPLPTQPSIACVFNLCL